MGNGILKIIEAHETVRAQKIAKEYFLYLRR